MEADVRGIEANDISTWPDWLPNSPADEIQWFTVSVGARGHVGADCFQIAVATHQGIQERRTKQKFVGLVVARFDPQLVENAIREYVGTCADSSWDLVVKKLRRQMTWEYDSSTLDTKVR